MTKDFEALNIKSSAGPFYLDEDTHRPSNNLSDNQTITRHELSEEQGILHEDTEVAEKLPDAFKTLSETSYHTLTTRERRPVRNVQILEAEYIENEETITPPDTNTTMRKNRNFKLEAFVSRPDDEVGYINQTSCRCSTLTV